MGIFRSADGGKTWENRGLGESHHIGRISLHPDNPDEIAVAVLGHLYSPNKERGIFVSSDGGINWKHSLTINEHTGAIDLVRHSDNPAKLYCSTWERKRSAWNFTEGGSGSGIWLSEDAGANWKNISAPTTGFPSGANCGRIGLAYYSRNGEEQLYALVDNQNPGKEEEKKKEDGLVKEDFKTMDKSAFLALNDSVLNAFLKKNGFPEKYTADYCKKRIKKDEILSSAFYEYLYDANEELFNKPIIGAEVYKLQGDLWVRTHQGDLNDVVYSYGYYFGLIRVNPTDKNKIYIAGVPILFSEDGGRNFTSIDADNVHVDHHALWINPEREGHIINGNDGGINISYDNGKTYSKCNSPSVGQFYTVNVDEAEPYNVYGGLQDNGVWKGPSNYKYSSSWHQSGHYPYESIMGGDGMQIQIDTRDNATVYTGYQFGHYYRINADGSSLYIHPKHDLGEKALRWNWQTPIHLSKHNQDILYMASNRFHRSMDQGETWETLSLDLTNGGQQGDVPFGTITSIHESPLKFGFLIAGTDDGLVHISKDGGYNWELVSKSLPQGLWVSRVKFSAHQKNSIYVSLNAYRNDHFESYLYRSDDLGKTWNRLGLNLPAEPVNVVLEDNSNEELMYVGTDHGLYYSKDRGTTFESLSSMPAVPVHDLVIQPKAEELVVATHGRSLYKLPLKELRMARNWPQDSLAFFEFTVPKHNKNWGDSWSKWIAPTEPEITAPVHLPASGKYLIEILGDFGTVMHQEELQLENRGINYLKIIPQLDSNLKEAYEISVKSMGGTAVLAEKAKNDKYYLMPGKYELKISGNGKELRQAFELKERE
jgi:photosystem II stability/assembly factor-like uncharacterized protein